MFLEVQAGSFFLGGYTQANSGFEYSEYDGDDDCDIGTDGKYADKVDRVQQEAAKRLGGDATPNTEPDTPGTDAPKTDPNA